LVLKGLEPAGASLRGVRKVAGVVIFAYGNFLIVVIYFVLLALIIFLMVKGVNSLKQKQEAIAAPEAPSALSTTDSLLSEIRDELRRTPRI